MAKNHTHTYKISHAELITPHLSVKPFFSALTGVSSFHLLKLADNKTDPALRGTNPVFFSHSMCKHCRNKERPVELHLLGKVGSQAITWLFPAQTIVTVGLRAARGWKVADWRCKLNKLWRLSVQDSSTQPIKPKRNMPSDLLWIPARKIQQALSMMSKADSCQAACYQQPGSVWEAW